MILKVEKEHAPYWNLEALRQGITPSWKTCQQKQTEILQPFEPLEVLKHNVLVPRSPPYIQFIQVPLIPEILH